MYKELFPNDMAQAVNISLPLRKPGVDPRPDRLLSMVMQVPMAQKNHMLVTKTLLYEYSYMVGEMASQIYVCHEFHATGTINFSHFRSFSKLDVNIHPLA